MPMYSLKCSECGKVDDYLLAIIEEEVEVKCSKCGSFVSRKNNRVYLPSDAPAIKGATVVREQKRGTNLCKKKPKKKV